MQPDKPPRVHDHAAGPVLLPLRMPAVGHNVDIAPRVCYTFNDQITVCLMPLSVQFPGYPTVGAQILPYAPKFACSFDSF